VSSLGLSKIIRDNTKFTFEVFPDELQSGTTTKSKRIVRVDPKFALRRATDITDPRDQDVNLKMTTQETSQRVRVVQALAKDMEKEKKSREIRWQNFAKHRSTGCHS
jgi:hypothetical protein